MATGTIYADNVCNTVDPSSNADLFPGTYKAACTSDSQITFYSSGCTSSECTDSDGDGRCDFDVTTISAFYSLLNPPTQDVFDPSTQDEFISCQTMSGTGASSNLAVTLAIFGDCSIPECQGRTSPPATASPPTAPVVTPSPTVDLTDEMPSPSTSSGSCHAARVPIVVSAAAAVWNGFLWHLEKFLSSSSLCLVRLSLGVCN